MIETTNTIKEYYSSQILNQHYIGLQESYETAMMYTIDMYSKNQTFSTIIKNMPEKLGYTLHPESFDIVFQKMATMVKGNKMEESFYNNIKNADDLGFYNLDGNTLELKPGAYTNYILIEYKHNLAFIDKTPTFKLANDTSIPEHTINQEDTRIILRTPEPESPKESWYTTEFHFGSENQKILLYTLIAFVAIRAIAYYFKDEGKKDNIQARDDESSIDNEVLHSVSETLYLDVTLVYKMLLGFIPISLLIIYKLRYYYYNRLSAVLNKII